jgi:hypothetical protein
MRTYIRVSIQGVRLGVAAEQSDDDLRLRAHARQVPHVLCAARQRLSGRTGRSLVFKSG